MLGDGLRTCKTQTAIRNTLVKPLAKNISQIHPEPHQLFRVGVFYFKALTCVLVSF